MTKNKKFQDAASSVPDLVEPFLDEASSKVAKEIFSTALPEIAKDLPVLKYIKTASDLYGAYRILKLNKRIKAFVDAIHAGGFRVEDFRKLSQDDQSKVVDVIITELDNHTDNLQSEALGHLFSAYISEKIDRLTFLGVAHELKNTNPLVFYFNVDGYAYKQKRPDIGTDLGYTVRKSGITLDSGPIHYLPASFKSNSTDMIAYSSMTFMTNLGEAFFKYVYEPMSKAHTI